jgi:cytochrome c-type biogenesis protein CcmF
MLNLFVGNLGHFFVILAFVTSLIAGISFFRETSSNSLTWTRFSRTNFYIHAISVLGVISVLFYIIYNHHYEYHYAWSHSSGSLPVYYMISCFWEGQEGSFLLWIFWNVVLGIILLKTNKFWSAPVMAIFCLVQAFLTSMILGVVIGDVKIGSSPFILMRDAMPDIPVFLSNPDFIPEDGKGLNPLLQNYWMVIHPPTLFLGFAATLIPFSYCIAGLWIGKFKEWVRPALPWMLIASVILGTGIIMGAYWAYETLNFGGYWNWDPVENAVYVPWLVMVASIHTMVIFRKSEKALKTSIILVITSFLLILYSTFLTRSGILGESSVHSFTDLGLYRQLLIYLLAFTGIAIFLIAKSWKKISIKSDEETSMYSREFWILIGAITLCLASFQIIIPTSFPVFNAIAESLGFISNLAPPAKQVEFYNKFQIWFAIAIALLSGTGQFFFWKKMSREEFKKVIYTPVVITLLVSAILLLLAQIRDLKYMLMLTAAVYSAISNLIIFVSIFKTNPRLTGGAVTHTGIALVLIGVLFSSGYSKVVSLNNTGKAYFADASEELNLENILLYPDEPVKMGEYQVKYLGPRIEEKQSGAYFDKSLVMPTSNRFKVVAKQDFFLDSDSVKKGDTIEVHPENTYYEIEYLKDNGKVFRLFPRAQINPNMGLIASPDIKRNLGFDLYTHVSSILPPADEREWSKPELFKVSKGDTFFVKDYIAIFQNIEAVSSVPGLRLNAGDIAVKGTVEVLGKTRSYKAEPYFIIKDKTLGLIPAEISALGFKVNLSEIDPASGKITLQVSTAQRDFVVMKAMEKPFINVLWLGTLLMIGGFCIAAARRYQEFKKMRDKSME